MWLFQIFSFGTEAVNELFFCLIMKPVHMGLHGRFVSFPMHPSLHRHFHIFPLNSFHPYLLLHLQHVYVFAFLVLTLSAHFLPSLFLSVTNHRFFLFFLFIHSSLFSFPTEVLQPLILYLFTLLPQSDPHNWLNLYFFLSFKNMLYKHQSDILYNYGADLLWILINL